MRVITDGSTLADLRGPLFVPTMGALHQGHAALIRRAVQTRPRFAPSDTVAPRPIIVSVFVNPTQFNDPKDLQRYPRTLDADAALCKAAGADALFIPPVELIYPPNHEIPVPSLPAVATQPGLEDALRPGHFAGVCQVVARLFNLVRPSAAFFGQKDWQQLQVIAAMTRELALPIDIIPVPTVREPDGLAMSSRNVFLSPEDRQHAHGLVRALRAAADQPTPRDAERTMQSILHAAGIRTEYAVIRQADSLLPPRTLAPARSAESDRAGSVRMRALIAGRIGAVRLIDNSAWPVDPELGQ